MDPYSSNIFQIFVFHKVIQCAHRRHLEIDAAALFLSSFAIFSPQSFTIEEKCPSGFDKSSEGEPNSKTFPRPITKMRS